MKTISTLFLILLLGVSPAWAVLGEYEGSVTLDQQYLRGEVRKIARDGYTLHRITSASGMIVNEYVSPAGLVFGVAWHGPAMPNLQQLLGSYFGPFQRAAQTGTRRRGPLVVRTDQLVVESSGHMRSFHGRAYLVNLLPKDVPPEVVR